MYIKSKNNKCIIVKRISKDNQLTPAMIQEKPYNNYYYSNKKIHVREIRMRVYNLKWRLFC